MDILFFNRSFYPDIEATGQLLTELCEELVKKGHNISVISGQPYHNNQKKLSIFISREKYKGINIIRTGGTILSKESLITRVINLSFYFLYAFVSGFIIKNKPQIIVTLTDPPVSGLLGIFFSKFYNAKFIYYCNDIYPDVGIATGKLKNPFLNFLLEKINWFSFKSAHTVICIGESMKKRIVQKGIKENKISVIHNWADTSKLYEIKKDENPFIREHNLQNKFVVMYSGNIGLTQNLEGILKVIEKFQNRNEFRFVLIGEGANKKKLIVEAQKLKLTNLDFLPYQSKETLKFSLSAADIHLIPFHKGLTGILVPSKIYGILACSKPFIAWVDEGSEIYEMAENFKCGITVPPGNLDKMKQAIEWAINNPEQLKEMGQRGEKVVREYFDKNISVNHFNKMVMELNKAFFY